jgi:hypothetical protein
MGARPSANRHLTQHPPEAEHDSAVPIGMFHRPAHAGNQGLVVDGFSNPAGSWVDASRHLRQGRARQGDEAVLRFAGVCNAVAETFVIVIHAAHVDSLWSRLRRAK